MGVPTDRRASVRLLLRPSGGSDAVGPPQRRMGGYLIMILGAAKAEDWPDSPFESGDLEGLIWTTPRQVDAVVTNLRAIAGIVDVKSPTLGSYPP